MTIIEITIPRYIYPIMGKIKNNEPLTMNEKIQWDKFDCDCDYVENNQLTCQHIPFEF